MSEDGSDKAEGFGLPDEPGAEKPIDPPDAASDPQDLESDVMIPQPEESVPIIRRSERGGVPKNYAKMNGGRGRRGVGVAGGMGRGLQEEDNQNRIRNRIGTSPFAAQNAPPASPFVSTGLGLSTELEDSTEGGGGACAEVPRGINSGIHKPQAVQVTHIKTGQVKVYPSMRHAGDALGINAGTVSRALQYKVGQGGCINVTMGFKFDLAHAEDRWMDDGLDMEFEGGKEGAEKGGGGEGFRSIEGSDSAAMHPLARRSGSMRQGRGQRDQVGDMDEMEEDNSDAEFFAQSRQCKANRDEKRKRGRTPPNALKSESSRRECPEEILSKGKTRKTQTQKGEAAAAAAAAGCGRAHRAISRKTATDDLAPLPKRKKKVPRTIMVTAQNLTTGDTQTFSTLRRCGEALGIDPGTISRALEYGVGLKSSTNETKGFAFTQTLVPPDAQQAGGGAAAAASSAAAAASTNPTQRRVARGRGAIDSLALAVVSTTRMPKVAARGRGGKGLGRGRGRGRGGRGGRARKSSTKPPVMEEEQEASDGYQSDAEMDPSGWMDGADEGGEGDWDNVDDHSHYHPDPWGPPPGYFRDHPMHAHRGFGPSYYPHHYPPYNQPPYHPPTSTSNDNPYQQQQGHREGYTNNNTAGGRDTVTAPNPMFRPRFPHWAYSYRPPHSNMYSPPHPHGYRAYPPGPPQPPTQEDQEGAREEGQQQRGDAQSQKRGDRLSPPPDERQTQRRDPHRPEPGHFPMPGPWGDRSHAGRMMGPSYSCRDGAAAAAAAAPGGPPMRPRAGPHAPYSFWSPYQQTFPSGEQRMAARSSPTRFPPVLPPSSRHACSGDPRPDETGDREKDEDAKEGDTADAEAEGGDEEKEEDSVSVREAVVIASAYGNAMRGWEETRRELQRRRDEELEGGEEEENRAEPPTPPPVLLSPAAPLVPSRMYSQEQTQLKKLKVKKGSSRKKPSGSKPPKSKPLSVLKLYANHPM
uniref:Nuclease-associated modular DNA-binding 1 domain-containing protein n=1 Tax=Chromera velia CCMP2878 TaxID=1169474 RepID=A0A0G4FKD5_9ALVE|eukprot:Cvel_17341.t1-p1 / transcript=Cvel_17341.t1 / gene=Cvel_17341 / organism=Chromera_velia_CCMP2878 / gene_product=hypothetical protein / transcript_product=hypothetical protein / location=Cvel_scaffold1378:8816-12426(-) / protein_length=974 / sequence_SO=supercontig / SO=protein_coding / is_pseudo=false